MSLLGCPVLAPVLQQGGPARHPTHGSREVGGLYPVPFGTKQGESCIPARSQEAPLC